MVEANLQYTVLHQTDLRGADLTDATLYEAGFSVDIFTGENPPVLRRTEFSLESYETADVFEARGFRVERVAQRRTGERRICRVTSPDATLLSHKYINGNYMAELRDAFMQASETRTIPVGRTLVIPRVYLDEMDVDLNIQLHDEIVIAESIEEARALAVSDEGSQDRIVLLRTDDMDQATRDNTQCRVIELQNYDSLHLAAAIELARSALAAHTESMDRFYELLTNQPITEALRTRLVTPKPNIIGIPLPPLVIPDENRRKLMKEYAFFLGQA